MLIRVNKLSKQTKQRVSRKYLPLKAQLNYWKEAKKEEGVLELLLRQKGEELEEIRLHHERAKDFAEKKGEMVYDWINEYVREESELSESSKEGLVNQYRGLWKRISRNDEPRRIALAVAHGIVERIKPLQIKHCRKWILDIADKIDSDQEVDACQIEIEACSLGLGVLDPERDPESIRALFGVVSEIEEGEARLSMSIPEGKVDPTLPLWESYWVPISELPEAYVIENVWIAWVERTYICNGVKSKKGRFEPASNSPKKLPKKILEVYADLLM